MADDIFDFGFTVVNEDELEVAQKATKLQQPRLLELRLLKQS